MGHLFYKYAASINRLATKDKLIKIVDANSEFRFEIGSVVPLALMQSFVKSQERARKYLLENYKEDIDTYTVEGLEKILNEVNGNETVLLPRLFALVYHSETMEIVGRLDLTKENRAFRLETLYVDADIQGRGIGSWLVGSALLAATEQFPEIVSFVTNTNASNDNALKVLDKYGFFFKTSIKQFIAQRNEQLK